jgi:hypothetical protein
MAISGHVKVIRDPGICHRVVHVRDRRTEFKPPQFAYQTVNDLFGFHFLGITYG